MIIASLRTSIVRYAEVFFGASPDMKRLVIKAGGYIVRINAVKGVPNEKTLHVMLLVRAVDFDPKKIKNRTFRARLEGIGQFNAVTFSIPTIMPHIDEEWLKRFTSELFAVGYSWMGRRIIQGIREACEQTNRQLYDYVRAMVPNQELLTGFLFSAVADDKDFVVLDDVAVASAFTLAKNTSRRLGRSAADVVLQMMLEVVPINDSVIRVAVQHEDGLDLDLSRDEYYQRDNNFSQALRAVWGDSVTCFPIVRSGPMLLLAFYMTQYKEQLYHFCAHTTSAFIRQRWSGRVKLRRS
jgi:hypothetical protein